MTEETIPEEDRKIISIATRTPVDPPPEVPEPSAEPAPYKFDEEEIALLKKLMQEVTAGHITGLVVFAGVRNPEKDIVEYVNVYESNNIYDQPQMFLGAFEEQKYDMLRGSLEVYDEFED